jgi:hypothetical protein
MESPKVRSRPSAFNFFGRGLAPSIEFIFQPGSKSPQRWKYKCLLPLVYYQFRRPEFEVIAWHQKRQKTKWSITKDDTLVLKLSVRFLILRKSWSGTICIPLLYLFNYSVDWNSQFLQTRTLQLEWLSVILTVILIMIWVNAYDVTTQDPSWFIQLLLSAVVPKRINRSVELCVCTRGQLAAVRAGVEVFSDSSLWSWMTSVNLESYCFRV